jgi:hypothetical protein
MGFTPFFRGILLSVILNIDKTIHYNRRDCHFAYSMGTGIIAIGLDATFASDAG